MACILKLPLDNSKGVVTFTTQEWRVIRADKALLGAMADLRRLYLTGLHFNWHDFHFDPPEMFDFFMAGEEDLRPINDKPYRLVPMDACNFTPTSYKPAKSEEKYWDVLAVGNPVFFKRPEVVLRTIRALLDEAKRPLKILYICPIPRYKMSNEDTVLYNVRSYYEVLFSEEERTRFTLLTTTFDSPNPFDRNTLSVFFRNSRVFLHCATEERRCRIAAYAWCAGLPVVAYPSVASILPAQLRTTPGYFEVTKDDEYVPQILKALENSHDFDSVPYLKELSESYTSVKLESELKNIFDELKLPYQGQMLTANLDRRLGWHHQGIGGTSNGLQQPLLQFMETLTGLKDYDLSKRSQIMASEYPEKEIAGEIHSVDPAEKVKVERNSIYLNEKKKRWIRLTRHLLSKLKFS